MGVIMELLGNILPWVQVALSVALILLVLMQQSEAGLGNAFGGSSGGQSFRTKRGLEKVFFIATIVISILFGASALLALFI